MSTDIEYRCPACGVVTDHTRERCAVCGVRLSHTIAHPVCREPIFPEPILVRHGDASPSFPMNSTAHMHKNCAPVDGQYLTAETTEETRMEQAPQVIDVAARPARYLIVGGGVAGVAAAEAVRAADETGEILLVTEEAEPPYRRSCLPERLAARQTQLPPLRTEAQQASARMTLYTDTQVFKIDAAAHVAETSRGPLPYDKCILAVGGTTERPPFARTEQPNVFSFYNHADLQQLSRALTVGQTVAVVGGGPLGIECAFALAARGMAVELLEAREQLLPTLVHRTIAAEVARRLRAVGVSVRTSTVADALAGNGAVRGIVTADGKEIACQSVVLTTGVCARTELAAASDVPFDKHGIPTDSAMRTDLSDVWACGMAAVPPNAPARRDKQFAVESAEVAGTSAAGQPARYAPHLAPLMLPLGGETLCVLGDCGKDAYTPYRIVTYQSAGGSECSEYFFRDGHMVGASVLSPAPDVSVLCDAVARGISAAELFSAHAFHAVSRTASV